MQGVELCTCPEGEKRQNNGKEYLHIFPSLRHSHLIFVTFFGGMCNKCRVPMSPKVKRALTFLLGICIIFHAMFPLCTDKLILRTYLMKIDPYSFTYILAPAACAIAVVAFLEY